MRKRITTKITQTDRSLINETQTCLKEIDERKKKIHTQISVKTQTKNLCSFLFHLFLGIYGTVKTPNVQKCIFTIHMILMVKHLI